MVHTFARGLQCVRYDLILNLKVPDSLDQTTGDVFGFPKVVITLF